MFHICKIKKLEQMASKTTFDLQNSMIHFRLTNFYQLKEFMVLSRKVFSDSINNVHVSKKLKFKMSFRQYLPSDQEKKC